jgi:hypothetical protein
MADLTAAMPGARKASWGYKKLLGADSTQFWQGGAVGFETASNANQGRLVPCVIAADSTVVFVGFCFRSVLTTTSTKVEVKLPGDAPIELHRFNNASSSISATSLGSLCYFSDDHTVTLTSTNNPLAGRVYEYDSATDTVLVVPVNGAVTTAAGSIAANQVTAGTAYQYLRTNSGATASEWGQDPDGYAVINATNDVSIQVSQGFRRKITACGDTKVITLATTGARAGHEIHVVRPAIGATTACSFLNGGTGAGTLLSMTSNKIAGAIFMFDGTDWNLVSNYQAS